jgi:PhnB protein
VSATGAGGAGRPTEDEEQAMLIQPYLFFNGRCEEALDFYKKTVGAKVEMLMRFKDCPDPQPGMVPPGSENKVMHASVKIGDSQIMASDGQCGGKTSFEGFSLSVTVKDETEAKRVFTALGEGGQVRMPLGKTFFSPSFGVLADRFGIGWMVIVPMAQHAH